MNAVQTFKLTREFNGLVAVNGIDLEIKKGQRAYRRITSGLRTF